MLFRRTHPVVQKTNDYNPISSNSERDHVQYKAVATIAGSSVIPDAGWCVELQGLPQLQDAAAVAGKGGEQLREEPLAAAHKPELRPPARTGRLRNGSAG